MAIAIAAIKPGHVSRGPRFSKGRLSLVFAGCSISPLFPLCGAQSLTAVKDVFAKARKFYVIIEGDRRMPPTEMNVPKQARPERVPVMQRILDNPFLLLFLGITIPTVLYVVWGVMEVASIPIGK